MEEDESYETKVIKAEATYEWLKDTVHSQQEEIERLNNIINNLEKGLKENREFCLMHGNMVGTNFIDIVLHQLQQLKEKKQWTKKV